VWNKELTDLYQMKLLKFPLSIFAGSIDSTAVISFFLSKVSRIKSGFDTLIKSIIPEMTSFFTSFGVNFNNRSIAELNLLC